MAQKKGGGSTRNGRDSESKRLGVKIYGDQFATSGAIIVRQRGSQYHPGAHVGIGKDHTLYARRAGHVQFSQKGPRKKRVVSVIPVNLELPEIQ